MIGEAGSLGEVVRTFDLGVLKGGTDAARGAMGRVFRVETSAGVWAVKELFPIASHHNLLAEMILATLRGDTWARDVLESMLAYPFTLEYLKRALDAVT
ncbi:MAG TPA: hypothetical protein VFN74_13950 [Chloroflexota bacterium]|nr:hypothetical protein [Chloroflexota bacterium]